MASGLYRSGKSYTIFIGDPERPARKFYNHERLRSPELINPKNRRNALSQTDSQKQSEVSPGETVISCKFTIELNAAGMCEFTLPASHPYANAIVPMETDVLIVEIDNIVWYGRVTSVSKDFDNNLTARCESALAFLNDTVQPYEGYSNLTPEGFIEKLLKTHNEQLTPPTDENGNAIGQVPLGGGFAVGNIKQSDITLSGAFNYETTFDALLNFQQNYGGYLYATFYEKGLYVNWTDARVMDASEEGLPINALNRDYILAGRIPPTDDESSTYSQKIEYGLNLLELNREDDLTNVCSAILPLGADVEIEVPDTDDAETTGGNDDEAAEKATKIIEVPLNIGMEPDPNVEADEDGLAPIRFVQKRDGTDLLIDSPLLSKYGRIIRAVRFDDVYDVAELRSCIHKRLSKVWKWEI